MTVHSKENLDGPKTLVIGYGGGGGLNHRNLLRNWGGRTLKLKQFTLLERIDDKQFK